MQINRQQILRSLVGMETPPIEAIDEYVASFNMWAVYFGVDTPQRIAMYLAQTFHESALCKRTEENLNYSADGLLKTFPKYFKTRDIAEAYARKPEKIANRVYANRMGNGNEASGDGWKYRGRGYIMLTGKSNYEQFSKYDLCTKDVMKNPDSVAKYPLNQVCSMWFWEKNNLNEIADTEDVDKATKVINGGTNGLSDRKLLYRRFAREFGIKKM